MTRDTRVCHHAALLLALCACSADEDENARAHAGDAGDAGQFRLDAARHDGGAGGDGARDGGDLDAGPTEPPPAGKPWSDPATWPSGVVPGEGEAVTIPAGTSVLLDVSPPPLGGLTIEGSLAFAEQELSLSASWILVLGTLQVGSAGRPFPSRATITLTSADVDEDVQGMGTRGILVMGTLELHARAPQPTWTRLGDHAAVAATTLQLAQAPAWSAGDELLIAPTDFFRIGGTERATITDVDGELVSVQAGLGSFHFGKLQYVTDDGMSFTPTTSVTPTVLDERAEVGNLTRDIRVEAPDDARWRDSRFGAHVMMMAGATAHIEGVRFSRMGQAGHTGRYPVHFHLLSYAQGGSELGDATGQYLRDSVIHDSSQRCVVIHGTNGLQVKGNICHQIVGHAFFLEDAVERRNVLEGNLVVSVRVPRAAELLMQHEKVATRNGPAGFWLTNPDNTVRGNAVADSAGIGFWLAFPQKPLNLLKAVKMEPIHTPFGVFEDNVAHSNQVSGLMLDLVPVDDAGHTEVDMYIPVQGGFDTGSYFDHIPFTMSRMTSYKHELFHGDGVFWNRARNATFDGFVLADFDDIGFKGSSQECVIKNALVVGTSLNATNLPSSGNGSEGAASYHSQCQIKDNVFVNLPALPGKPSGAFATGDYYLRPVDKGLFRNPNNRLIQTPPGYRRESPNILGTENWALAGALWDPHGYFGPAGHYWVYDLPYLTFGTSCQAPPGNVHGNDQICAGPYYGIPNPRLGREGGTPTHETRALRFERNDNGTVWEIPQGMLPLQLVNMRHGALVKGGDYTLRFPGTALPSSVIFTVTNVMGPSDQVLFSVEYDGNKTPLAFATAWANEGEVLSWAAWTKWKAGDPSWSAELRAEYLQPLTAAATKADVINGAGDNFYRDTANNLIWVHVKRGRITPLSSKKDSDDDLNRPITYVFDDNL